MNEQELREFGHAMVGILRPFAKVADAQKHTDCGGMLKQSDWELAARVVSTYDEAQKESLGGN